MNIVDSSVWVDYLRGVRGRAASHLREQLGSGDLPAITEPIVMELLAGASTAVELSNVERLTDGLPVLSILPELDFRDAATIYRTARSQGRTLRRLNDCLIAAIAIRHNATLIHKDADFEAIAECVRLAQVSLR